MELAVLEKAMTEQLKEQQTTSELVGDLVKKVDALGEKVAGFEKKLESQPVVAPPMDTGPIQRIVAEFLDRVTRIVAGQPKNIIRQWRLLLFPETNAGQYYKIVFGRLIPWSFLFIISAYLVTLCRDYLESSSRIRERQYYYEIYQDAWNRLDTTLGPIGRKKMQEALRQAAARQ